MPTRKDLKRLVRARMAKTGESYTTARAHVTRSTLTLPRDYRKLAGMGDDAVRAKTGRSWREWVAALDDIGATEMSHRDIARWVADKHDFGGWWSQTVTVGYERIRGLRAVGQGRDGAYSASKSRTLPFAETAVRRAIEDARTRAEWLPEREAVPRGKGRTKAFRFSCPDGTRGEIRLTAKGATRTQVVVEHEGLPSAEALDERKAFWEERLEELRRKLSDAAD